MKFFDVYGFLFVVFGLVLFLCWCGFIFFGFCVIYLLEWVGSLGYVGEWLLKNWYVIFYFVFMIGCLNFYIFWFGLKFGEEEIGVKKLDLFLFNFNF